MTEYLPRLYTAFVEKYPEIAEAHNRLSEACHNGGPLDDKTRHLIKLGISTALQSEGGVKAQTRLSLDGGATADEIRHAVLLSLTTSGFPAMRAALSWVEEVLTARVP